MKQLEVKNLVIHYETDAGIVEAVNSVSFDLDRGETLGLVGETGAGKTTIALGIMNLVPDPPGRVKAGEVLFEGDDLLQKKPKEMRKIRGNKISMIFQDPMTALNPVKTVADQISEVIRLHQKLSRADALRKACEMLELVGISAERINDYPHQFSGGMKQRVVIAIALACNPTLLIADEPTTALDVTIQAQVIEMMGRLKRELQTSMILITHDLGVVAEMCDKVAIMYAGEIVEYGTLEDIYEGAHHHPYTVGLFGAIPDLDRDTERLTPIDGLMPDPMNLPQGCNFCPRCPHRTEACEHVSPQAYEVSPGHTIKCHLFGKEEA
ncbi:MAG: dipeptide/oligopeptide/nickel ABC transporter ATP-binding protein [Prevotellaceae bacterium]|nr:MAG: dipeptide/oligopeptide/nickel ABC transporter ATP-binding protein [Prevotellaceae bacterium]